MKKIIQICSILSLLVVFTAISAQAQTMAKRFETQIPFDFNIGQKSFKSGTYVIRLANASSRVMAFTLEDENGNVLESTLVTTSGQISKKDPELVFTRLDNQRYLTKLRTPDLGFLIFSPDVERAIARKNRDRNGKKEISLVTSNQ